MTDIVERLRKHIVAGLPPDSELREDAADEIERLRDWGTEEARRAFEAEGEIERLRAEKIHW